LKSGKGVAALERRTGWRGSSLTRVGQAVKLSGEDMIGGDVEFALPGSLAVLPGYGPLPFGMSAMPDIPPRNSAPLL
jgi:hypothetical protein